MEIKENELSLVNRYGLEEKYVDEIRCEEEVNTATPPTPLSAPLPNSNQSPLPHNEMQCHACKSWCDLTSERIPLDRAQDTSSMDSWCAPFNQFYCPECKTAGKAVTLTHYSNPTSEEQVDFIDSDLVNMDSTKLRALLKSKSDCQFDVCDITCLIFVGARSIK